MPNCIIVIKQKDKNMKEVKISKIYSNLSIEKKALKKQENKTEKPKKLSKLIY